MLLAKGAIILTMQCMLPPLTKEGRRARMKAALRAAKIAGGEYKDSAPFADKESKDISELIKEHGLESDIVGDKLEIQQFCWGAGRGSGSRGSILTRLQGSGYDVPLVNEELF
jgi:hypothetical protein